MTRRDEPETASPWFETLWPLGRSRAQVATRTGLLLLAIALVTAPWSSPSGPDRAPAEEARARSYDPPPPPPAPALRLPVRATSELAEPAQQRAEVVQLQPAGAAPSADAARAADPDLAPAAPISAHRASLRLIAVTADGTPASGARFEVSGRALKAPRLVVADERGRAALTLDPGSVRAVAFGPEGMSPAQSLRLEAGGQSSATLALRAGHPVTGRVVDATSGRPLAGARVAFWTHAELDAAETGSDGRFTHPRFPAAGGTHQVRVEAEGYGPTVSYLQVDAAGTWTLLSPLQGGESVRGAVLPAEIDLELLPAASLTGLVVDGTGTPLAGVRVEAEGFAQVLPGVGSSDRASATTGSSGVFTLAGLRADLRHRLELSAPGFASARLAAPRGAGTTDLGRIALAAEATLAGNVFDPEGEPAEGVRVTLELAPEPGLVAAPEGLDLGWPQRARRPSRHTDTAGTFLFDALPPGQHTVRVHAEGTILFEQGVALDPESLTGALVFQLPPETLTLKGRVAHRGEPVAGAAVTLERGSRKRTVTTGPGGEFRAAGLDDAGSYAVHVRAQVEGRVVEIEERDVWAFGWMELELGDGDWVAVER